MHWRVQLLILFLTALAAGMGYLYFTRDQRLANQQAASITVEPEEEEVVEQQPVQLAKLLAVSVSLDPEQAATAAAMQEFVSEFQPGFVVLFGEGIASESAQAATTQISQLVVEQDQPMIFVDHEGGQVQRLSGAGFTRLPTWRRVCQLAAEQRQDLFASSAAQLRDVGIDGVLAPVVDVVGTNTFMRERICSADPEVVAQVAAEYVTAFSNAGVAPVLKHYPGLGTATRDPHDGASVVTIRPEDVTPFQLVLDSWPDLAVMTTHVGVMNQFPEIPCSLSPSCVEQIYELYPEAMTMTDALEMSAARYNPAVPDEPKSLSTVALQAIRAGNHVVLFGPDVTREEVLVVLENMRSEYTSSYEFRMRVDAALARIDQFRAQWSE